MTTLVDIANRALQAQGTRTTIATLSENSNEAIQTNLVITALRDEILRMAPWNCAANYKVLTYITSMPGSPENLTSGTVNWQKGIPAPPWAYEYQYPVDCLRAIFVVPQYTTGFSGGVPITTAITGGLPNFWNGPPVRFRVAIDQFFSVNAATVAAGGSGYVAGDIITLATTPPNTNPIGAPAQLQVATIGGGGAVATVTVVNAIQGEATALGGSYFAAQTNPVAQSSTTGVGVGATFNLVFQATDQRTILTNQEFAILNYVRQVTDPNVMDPQFIQAWVAGLAGRLVFQLTGDRALANQKLQEANSFIATARIGDGNEGLTINDVVPDWIRIRGFDAIDPGVLGPNLQFDWGPMLTLY
jgi:hypothetical protein